MDKANKNEFEYEILNGDFSEFESYISFKIILVGTPHVRTTEFYPKPYKEKTLDFEHITLNMKYKDKFIKLYILDTHKIACSYRMSTICEFCKNASLIIMVYTVDE